MPEGFKQIGGPANGVSVAVPKAWVAIDLTKDDLEKGLKDSGLSGSTLQEAKKSLQTLVDNKGIWASDPKSAQASPQGFPTNLNAFCQAGRQTSIEQLLQETTDQLKQLKAKVVESGKVTIGSRQAARIVYTFPIEGIDVQGTQYYVPTENKTCIVTLSTDVSGKQKLFDEIGQTIRPVSTGQRRGGSIRAPSMVKSIRRLTSTPTLAESPARQDGREPRRTIRSALRWWPLTCSCSRGGPASSPEAVPGTSRRRIERIRPPTSGERPRALAWRRGSGGSGTDTEARPLST